MNALLGLLLEELDKNTKLIHAGWVSTVEMEQLGSDGLSRGIFRPEGYTVAECMVSKLKRVSTEMFGILESRFMRSFETT